MEPIPEATPEELAEERVAREQVTEREPTQEAEAQSEARRKDPIQEEDSVETKEDETAWPQPSATFPPSDDRN